MHTIPDTALARAANEILVTSSPPTLVGHCRRTYQFGAQLLVQAGRTFDTETLYVACLLHDLGLTDQFEDGETAFEIRGAQVAQASLLEHGATPEQANLVYDAIALHLRPADDELRAEVTGVTIGAAVDVLGLRLDELPKHFVAQALEEFPRDGLKAYLQEALVKQGKLKPTSRIARYIEKYQFADLVAATPFDS
ncbi:HD domain-containing protein [Catelliglobosispora koreensis]|uniref:HD domain-containing protein n=1 Tax=Catelliglobosispora koreensis TaxID=129052 RepID=UPI0003760FC3|nr:HD domain-containing protein [Catelliglobosispora koreensis]